MTDTPGDDDFVPDEPAPTPASGGGATGAAASVSRPGRAARPGAGSGRTVRIGCVLLITFGVLGVFLGVTTASNPERGRCTQARTILEDELDDLDLGLEGDDAPDFGEIDCDTVVPLVQGVAAAVVAGTGDAQESESEEPELDCDTARSELAAVADVDAEAVECREAVPVARLLHVDEDDPEFSEPATASTLRTFGYIIVGIGLVQIAGGFLTMRFRTKRARLIALAGAAIGIVFSPLGLLGIPILGFVVYATFFSADARLVFGDPGGPRMFRPRT